jgi:hypothetical protein
MKILKVGIGIDGQQYPKLEARKRTNHEIHETKESGDFGLAMRVSPVSHHKTRQNR